ncbi:hypothetical protein HDU85_005614 [Gaertneriomyces sp. JEL0708]|nr:hypothetical protein HDU85_005614 [Gaertneriomyces sp. JEL0708]
MSDDEFDTKDLFGSDSEEDEAVTAKKDDVGDTSEHGDDGGSRRSPSPKPTSAEENTQEEAGNESEEDERPNRKLKARRRISSSPVRSRSRSPSDDAERDLFGDDDEEGSNNLMDIDDDELEAEFRDRPRYTRPEKPPKPDITKEIYLPERPRFSQTADDVYLSRLPNFMHVQPEPFDPSTFDEEEEAEEQERDDGLHLSVDNVIRWRELVDSKGAATKESNARLIRWEDGSFSMVLGTEFYDVSITDGVPHQYLTVQFPEQAVFQTQDRVSRTAMFKPYGLNQSVHKRLTREIAKKHQKTIKTRSIVSMVDPQKQREALEKSEMEKVRARRRLEAKRRSTGVGSSRYMTARDLEDESDDDAYTRGSTNIRAALDSYEQDDFVVEDDEDDDAGFDSEEERERDRRERILRAKKEKSQRVERDNREGSPPPKRKNDEDEDSERGNSDDDISRNKSKRKRHIVSSEDEDE